LIVYIQGQIEETTKIIAEDFHFQPLLDRCILITTSTETKIIEELIKSSNVYAFQEMCLNEKIDLTFEKKNQKKLIVYLLHIDFIEENYTNNCYFDELFQKTGLNFHILYEFSR